MVQMAIEAKLWDQDAGEVRSALLVLRVDDEDDQDADRIDAHLMAVDGGLPLPNYSLDFNRVDLLNALNYLDTERKHNRPLAGV